MRHSVLLRLHANPATCRSMENCRVGPGRVWVKWPRSTDRPRVGGCTSEAELDTASFSRSRASFHKGPCSKGKIYHPVGEYGWGWLGWGAGLRVARGGSLP